MADITTGRSFAAVASFIEQFLPPRVIWPVEPFAWLPDSELTRAWLGNRPGLSRTGADLGGHRAAAFQLVDAATGYVAVIGPDGDRYGVTADVSRALFDAYNASRTSRGLPALTWGRDFFRALWRSWCNAFRNEPWPEVWS